MTIQITESDCEFGRSIADVSANLAGEVRDPLRWVADVAAGKDSPDGASALIEELREILQPVLMDGWRPNDSVRARCLDAYTRWLATL